MPPWVREGVHGRVLRATRERLLSVSHRFFLDTAFRALLWRPPDPVGRRHFLGALRWGRMTRFQVLRDLGQSAEAAKHVLWGPGLREHVQGFARADVPADVRPLCFLHPMKCGGTALTYGLSTLAESWPRILDVWADQLVCLPQPMLARAVLVTGHLPYAALEVLAPGTATCTIVRDPVSRTLSHFSHVRTHGQESGLTIEDFVHVERWRATWVNYQARHLAADVPVLAAWRGQHADELQVLLDAPAAVDDETLGRQALSRLESIDLVGVSDDVDGLLRKVAELWHKPSPPPLPRSNESLAPVRASDVSTSVLAAIVAGTRVDAQLYERATAISGRG